MIVNQLTTPYIFVIDTDQYSGNFERQMAAFITGAVSDCGVGSDQRAMFLKNGMCLALTSKVSYEHNDKGFLCCVSIWPTPGRYNNGYGIHFYGDPVGKGQYLAYESVAIFLSERPTNKELNFMKQRATSFAQDWSESSLSIRSFRLFERRLVVEETIV